MALPRIPLEAGGIQVNHCRTPGCLNFGVPAATEDPSVTGVPAPYKVVHGGKGIPAIQCDFCQVSVLLKSNQGIREEVERISAYLTPPSVPAAACSNRRCGSYRKGVDAHPELYFRHGAAKGRPRWRCKECGRTCSAPKPKASPTDGQREPHKNPMMLRALLGKMPVRRLLDALDVSPSTFYARLEFFERQFLAFAGERERRFAEMPYERLYLASDQQFYLVNWRDRGERRAIHMRAVGTADNRTRYVFAINLNYDPGMNPEELEANAALCGDERRKPPFRKYARLWLQADYEKAAQRKGRVRLADSAKADIEETYKELLARDEDDPAGEISELVRLPARGVQVHNDYTIFGHFHHLRSLFRSVEKTRWYVDQDSAMRGGILSAFTREIRAGACDIFFVKVNRHMTEKLRLAAAKTGREHLAMLRNAPGNQDKTDAELRRELVRDAMTRLEAIGPWGDLWLRHPVPTKDEPEKLIWHVTGGMGAYSADPDHLASLYDLASLKGIEQFFMQVRRRFSLLERMLNRAGRGDRIWNIYSPYEPVVVQRLVNIFRVYYNFSKPGADGKTPAMRLGLAAGPVDVGRIINFKG